MIEFILLNLPPLTCPLPGCYLLTTFRQCSYFPLLLFHVPNPFTSLRPRYHSCGLFVCINTQPHPLGSILLPKELFGIILSFVQCPSLLKSDLINSLTVFFWEIPWSEGPGGLQTVGSRESQWGHHLVTKPPPQHHSSDVLLPAQTNPSSGQIRLIPHDIIPRMSSSLPKQKPRFWSNQTNPPEVPSSPAVILSVASGLLHVTGVLCFGPESMPGTTKDLWTDKTVPGPPILPLG